MLGGHPDNNHILKGNIINIVMHAGIEHAKLLGKENLRFLEPVDGLISIYKDEKSVGISGVPNG
jgi:hypothetical protein